MKLLLVCESGKICETIEKSVVPLGFELIQYRHMLKAMDNIDEIDPVAVLVSARDFPRHWKILVQYIRDERPREICPIIVLKDSGFSAEETSKAFFLGASEVMDDVLSKPDAVDRLIRVLGRHVPVKEKRRHKRLAVEPWNRIGFIAAPAAGTSLITGEVTAISARGLSFSPDKTVYPSGSTLPAELRDCSLRAGDAILSPVCRVVRKGRSLSLEFIAFPGDEQRVLTQYLDTFFMPETITGKAS